MFKKSLLALLNVAFTQTLSAQNALPKAAVRNVCRN